MKSEKEHGLKPIAGKPKVIHGGRFFTNPNREPKPREVNPLEQGFSMGASRGFTLCERFRDWDDCSNHFPIITCPECMESDIYRTWLRRLVVLRLKYSPWDYKFHRGIFVATWIDMDCNRKAGGLNYE